MGFPIMNNRCNFINKSEISENEVLEELNVRWWSEYRRKQGEEVPKQLKTQEWWK